MTIYTIGHGNRPEEELRELLRAAGVAHLVDVRAHPGSRRHPHFSRDVLAVSLPQAGIRYTWAGAALGGRRRPRADTRHVGWRNASFRAYADHMESRDFTAAVDDLVRHAAIETPAVMCAERLPWQCHRYLIADALVARGVEVIHIIGRGSTRAHALNPMARREGDHLIYDRGVVPDLGLDT